MPALKPLYDYAWFVGFAVAFVVYAALLREALLRLLARRRRVVLTSHGPAADPAILDSALFYLDTVGRRIHGAWRSPRPEEEIAAIPLSECMPSGAAVTEFESTPHERNLRSAFERHLFERSER